MFGGLVRAHRRRLGLTQQELADKAGLGVRSIRKIETGRIRLPRPPTVRILADAFGLAGAERDRFCEAAAEPAEAGDTPDGRPRPSQLPADVSTFTGRRAELTRLDALLIGSGPRARPAAAIPVVSGTAGVGKTALAIHWAHRVAHRFPDGQLYVNLRGFDPEVRQVDPGDALGGLLDALGVRPERVPADLSARTALYRSLLAGKRILVLLDNARDAEQVRPLLPGSPTVLTVITSRDPLTGLTAANDAEPIALNVLSTREARELLDRRLGPDRTAAEPEATDAIITGCAALPLALTVAAARVQQTGFSLGTIASELRAEGHRLDTLDTGDAAGQVRTVFSWSYRELSPAAARLFRLFGSHPGADISLTAAASLAGLRVRDVRRLLAELTRANLMTEHVPDRFACHDLLRDYAAELTAEHDDPDDRREASRRLFDHYLLTAHTADRLLRASRDPCPMPLAPPAPDTTPEPLADDRAAQAWLVGEHPALMAVLQQAAAAGFHAHCWQLAWSLTRFLAWQGHLRDRAHAWRTALAAAQALDDADAGAYARRCLAGVQIQLGDPDSAEEHLQRSVEHYAAIGDPIGQAEAHRVLSLAADQRGRPVEALDHDLKALALCRTAGPGHRLLEANILNEVGCDYAELGDLDRALAYCEEALSLAQHLEDHDERGEAPIWDSIGYIHHKRGRFREAAECYRRAADQLRAVGDRYNQAETLIRLGDSLLAATDATATRAAWQAALDILEDLDNPDADGARARLVSLDSPVDD